jgi:hypothetical protein
VRVTCVCACTISHLNLHIVRRFVTEHPCCQIEQTIHMVGRPRALDGSADLRYYSFIPFMSDSWLVIGCQSP